MIVNGLSSANDYPGQTIRVRIRLSEWTQKYGPVLFDLGTDDDLFSLLFRRRRETRFHRWTKEDTKARRNQSLIRSKLVRRPCVFDVLRSIFARSVMKVIKYRREVWLYIERSRLWPSKNNKNLVYDETTWSHTVFSRSPSRYRYKLQREQVALFNVSQLQ